MEQPSTNQIGRSKSLDSSVPITGNMNRNREESICDVNNNPQPSFFPSWFVSTKRSSSSSSSAAAEDAETKPQPRKRSKKCVFDLPSQTKTASNEDTVQENRTFELSFDDDDDDEEEEEEDDDDYDDGFAQDVEFVYDHKNRQRQDTSRSSNSGSYGDGDGSRTTIVGSQDQQRPSLANNRMYDSKTPVSLEGMLRFRKSRSAAAGTSLPGWKNTYVVLDLTGYGSLTFLKEKPVTTGGESIRRGGNKKNKKKNRPRRGSTKPHPAGCSLWDVHDESDGSINELFHLPSSVNWIAKDVENSSTEFVIEIPTDMAALPFITSTNPGTDVGNDGDDDDEEIIPTEILDDFRRSKSAEKPFRLYFACAHRSNEKGLWLNAFGQLDRLSLDTHSKNGFQSLFDKKVRVTHRRIRTQRSHELAAAGKMLLESRAHRKSTIMDMSESEFDFDTALTTSGVRQMKDAERREFLVYPMYAYPNRWMTEKELYTDMLKRSQTFHDLRPSQSLLNGSIKNNGQKEIGTLKVEVLQCIGLPSLDLASETDAVVYLICGSYAFTTDVIQNKLNPIWLPKTRRACILPIFHAYASLYVGVFDDDGKGEKDDFAGRVVIDVAQLRTNSTYDVTLPLRLSDNVYSRTPRGAIRLRFSLNYHSEREAVLSYIPKTIRPPTSVRPDNDVTVLCADEKSFRNIATAVHGVHMPGRFSVQEFKATMREANFTRKVMTSKVKDEIVSVITWKNPLLSMQIFVAWMHCIYVGSFSLVPFYIFFFLFLTMVRTYTFYGSQGPVQQGFIPPSIEEILITLVKGDSTAIVPLKVKSIKKGVLIPRPQTYREKTSWFLTQVLGFTAYLDEAEDEDYHMEFPYSQGQRDPITGDVLYPKFSVEESLVIKSKNAERKQCIDEEEELAPSVEITARPKRSFPLVLRRGKSEPTKDLTKKTAGSSSSIESEDLSISGRRPTNVFPQKKKKKSPYKSFDEVPMQLRLPEQDIDARGPRKKKKKLSEEMRDLQNNLHKLTAHQFHHVTHVKPREDSVYFGMASRKGAKTGSQLDTDFDKLLNVGQYSSGNPIVGKMATYIEPIVSGIQSGLAVSRVMYNIVTWRDPILSFWVSAAFIAFAIVLLIFPWRTFLFCVGVGVVGPQNYILRVLDDHRMAPKPLQNKFDKMREPKFYRKKNSTSMRAADTFPIDQTVISCHSSDNSPPVELATVDVDPREIHQVCVPYSQLRSRRFYDWPPEPQYARCSPNPMADGSSPISSSSSLSKLKDRSDLSRSEHDRYNSLSRRLSNPTKLNGRNDLSRSEHDRYSSLSRRRTNAI
mmetsp:Transcript_7526/g.18547  ORF Transcript_7526/g.18547 Transcript_7526/m.18547 type:complete len:1306 (-) Transcript_7526:314-4231(-)